MCRYAPLEHAAWRAKSGVHQSVMGSAFPRHISQLCRRVLFLLTTAQSVNQEKVCSSHTGAVSTCLLFEICAIKDAARNADMHVLVTFCVSQPESLAGVDADLIVYVTAGSDGCGENHLAAALSCSFDATTNRPVAGRIHFCKFGQDRFQDDLTASVHELIHVLVRHQACSEGALSVYLGVSKRCVGSNSCWLRSGPISPTANLAGEQTR